MTQYNNEYESLDYLNNHQLFCVLFNNALSTLLYFVFYLVYERFTLVQIHLFQPPAIKNCIKLRSIRPKILNPMSVKHWQSSFAMEGLKYNNMLMYILILQDFLCIHNTLQTYLKSGCLFTIHLIFFCNHCNHSKHLM